MVTDLPIARQGCGKAAAGIKQKFLVGLSNPRVYKDGWLLIPFPTSANKQNLTNEMHKVKVCTLMVAICFMFLVDDFLCAAQHASVWGVGHLNRQSMGEGQALVVPSIGLNPM